jgi:hypothetical protein
VLPSVTPTRRLATLAGLDGHGAAGTRKRYDLDGEVVGRYTSCIDADLITAGIRNVHVTGAVKRDRPRFSQPTVQPPTWRLCGQTVRRQRIADSDAARGPRTSESKGASHPVEGCVVDECASRGLESSRVRTRMRVERAARQVWSTRRIFILKDPQPESLQNVRSCKRSALATALSPRAGSSGRVLPFRA